MSAGALPVSDKDRKAFLTETKPGDENHTKAVQFLDTPKPRKPAPAPKHADKYVAPASSASQTTTKLLQKRRKNTEWQQSLELKREEFAKRMSECDSRQSLLKKKCKELRKRVQTKEQEVSETRTKIERATKKKDEEIGYQHLKDKEIEEKKELVRREEIEQHELQQKLNTRNQYKAYLDRVCEEHEGTGLGFEEVDSILQKYESFQWTTKWLSDQRRNHVQEIEELRDSLSQYSKVSVTQVVEKNARISEGRALLDQLRNQTRDEAGKDENRKVDEQKRIKELGEIEMAVDNLYNRCFLQGKQTKASVQEAERLSKLADEDKILEMLSRLCVFFIDMLAISREAKHHLRSIDHPHKEAAAHQPARSKRTGPMSDELALKPASGMDGASSQGQRRASLHSSQDRRRSGVSTHVKDSIA